MIAIKDQTKFVDQIREKEVCLVEFGAEWCPPCKTLLPILDTMDKEYDGSVMFLKVDCDESPEISSQYEIMSMSTVIVFHHGEPVDKIVGLRSKSAYQAAIARYI